ncbi:MAG TPA: hypothetical protein DD433_10650 [Ruminococcaceae bacterium]|nr:hypothetical protein [Oscillospiraceae bacterium]
MYTHVFKAFSADRPLIQQTKRIQQPYGSLDSFSAAQKKPDRSGGKLLFSQGPGKRQAGSERYKGLLM